MQQITQLLTIDSVDASPFVSGHFQWPDFLATSDAGYDYVRVISGDVTACRAAGHKEIINTRFSSQHGEGNLTSMVFQSDFGMTIYDAVCSDKAVNIITSGDGWYQLTLRLSGDSLESINNQEFSVGQYSCSMIYYTAALPHSARIKKDRSFVEVDIYFRASLLSHKIHRLAQGVEALLSGRHNQLGGSWFINCAMPPDIEKAVRELLQFSLTSLVYPLYAEAKALELIAHFITQLASGNLVDDNPLSLSRSRQRFYELKKYLESHYNETVTINELCRLVGCNRRRLTEEFKAIFGKTVHQYIQSLRIEKAKVLLQQGASVSDVASQVGYGYQSNFTKVFRQHVGMSPKDFIKAGQKSSACHVWATP